jgi:hypothetical protein
MKTIAACFAATLLSIAAPPSAGEVGRFVYDQSGAIVGGLTAIQGASPVISDVLMFQSDYRHVAITTDALEMQNARVLLTGTAAAQLDGQHSVSLAAR